MIDYLIENGAKLNLNWSKYGSPFQWACGSERFNAMKTLLKHGVHIDEYDSNGGSSIHITSYQGNFNVVKFLLENKSNPNLTTKEDLVTPLHLAVEKENIDIIKVKFQKF